MEYYICKQKTSLWTLLCYKLSRSWIWSCLLFSEHFWNTWEPAYGAQGWTRCPASREEALSISGVPSVAVFYSLFFQILPFLRFHKQPFLWAPFSVPLVSSAQSLSSKLFHNLWSSFIRIHLLQSDSLQYLLRREPARVVVVELRKMQLQLEQLPAAASSSSTRRRN